jgi:eukaryotic-like serine/threonine-protein kinase
MFVGDFGLADAFRDFGRNSGSRPYMAPEQFSASPIGLLAPPSFDVFALGVIAFECFTDGRHPIGVSTADVGPWRHGIPQKWNRESTWREWANKPDKSVAGNALPPGMDELIVAALASDALHRPSLEKFESELWNALSRLDAGMHDGLQMQVQYVEGLSSGDSEWPHMDERLTELRQFYCAFETGA